ncbi:MAG: hypothetical protein FWG65_07095 [Turicibacter sp.]|nr:hypothetical protein [Turicibacter sp.]
MSMTMFFLAFLILVGYLLYQSYKRDFGQVNNYVPRGKERINLSREVQFDLTTVDTTTFSFDGKIYTNMFKDFNTLYGSDTGFYLDKELIYQGYKFTKDHVSVKLKNGKYLPIVDIKLYPRHSKTTFEFRQNISEQAIFNIKAIYISLIAFYTWKINECINDVALTDTTIKTQQGNFTVKSKN